MLTNSTDRETFLATWRFGDWNEFRIRCVGRLPTVTVWINGLLVAEIDLGTLEAPHFDRNAMEQLLGSGGHIALEVHDNDPSWVHPDGVTARGAGGATSVSANLLTTRREQSTMTTPEFSVQLYSVHKPLEADLDGTLRRLADIGLRYVEAFDFVRRADALKTSFDRYGLSAPTGHAILIEDQVDTPDGLLTVPPAQETFAAAASLGLSIVIDPYVPPARWENLDDIQRSADRLNARAAQAATHGLRVGYHNHDAELSSIIDGKPALEVFADLLDPAVALEVDLYWAAAGGQDPADLLRRLGDRVQAVHVKDGPMRPGISAAQLPTDQTPAGQGDVPLAAALAAGSDIGYAVIEFDHYDGDIFDGIAQSYAFLGSTLGASR